MSDRKTRGIQRLLATMHYTGLDRIYQQLDQELGCILMFHHVNDAPPHKFDPNGHLTVTPRFFERILNMFVQRDFEFVTLDEAAERIKNPRRNQRFAVVTFDDGYRDNLEQAAPILQRLHIPYTVYVATGLVERVSDVWWVAVEHLVRERDRLLMQTHRGPVELDCRSIKAKYASFRTIMTYLSLDVDEEEQRRRVREMCWLYKIDPAAITDGLMMDWDEVRQIADDPLCTIGAHTISHPALARLKKNAARLEMEQSASILEATLGQRPVHFAYPYGMKRAAGAREFALAHRCRFETAVTTRPGHLFAGHAKHLTALPRVSANGLYQRMRYFSPLTSGLPTRLANKGRRINIT
ncbi:MAG: polysaccharide deacetylase family protein [Pseudomonadota bacterium]